MSEELKVISFRRLAMSKAVLGGPGRSIAFDASAELELRAAYAATGEPRLLLEAAQEAVNAGHVGAAIVTIRQMYPQLESRPLAEVPKEVWFASYALPYLQTIRTHAAQAGVDPMLAAGLISLPEASDGSAFDTRAVTEGLFQVHTCKGHKRPPTAYVAVKYRGYWYFIDDRDQASKTTFALVLQLARMDFASQEPTGGPFLTLPVGR